MREIYNEGRVVGLSAYDLYVRQYLSKNPESSPMSESEWLASSISESSSMILKVSKGTAAGYHDYPLPIGCSLCGASVIYGSVFQGLIELDENDYWAIRVDDYGELISNTFDRHPVTPGLPVDVPTKENPQANPDWLMTRCENYLKIKSGLVIQPGEWIDNAEYYPLETEDPNPQNVLTQDLEEILCPQRGVAACETLNPDLSTTGFVRLLIKERLSDDVYLLLHGFADRELAAAGLNILLYGKSRRPESGDFLGPSMFPWGCPIVFIATTDTISVIEDRLMMLASFHHIHYLVPIVTEDEDQLLTENSESLIAPIYGSVADMWREGGYPDPDYQ